MPETPTGPLAHISVLDCSRILAGPFATMLLGDLGADVIKVESLDGDDTRRWGPPFWGDSADGLSAYYASVNRNKRAIAIDLSAEDGQRLLDRLAERADVLVHNFRPSTSERLGLGADRLAQRHPQLVVASIGGFPGSAEERERPAYDLLAQAMTGFMAITGPADGEPSKVGVAVLDLLAGLELAVGILASLVGRERVPVHRVETNLIEAGVHGLVNVLANHLADGREPARYGSGHPNIVPYQAFEAADGHVVVAVGNDAQFRHLMAALELTDDGRFSTNAGRVERRAELLEMLAPAIRRHRRDDLLGRLEARGVPSGPLLSVGEAVERLDASADEPWVERHGPMRLAPNPLRLDGQRLPTRLVPPRIGQDTTDVLSEAGVSASEIERLRAAGVVG
jgi:crotonobetainyl-CoA:carnitine CoA-transferase CaiB-like acyl-CoA transferase